MSEGWRRRAWAEVHRRAHRAARRRATATLPAAYRVMPHAVPLVLRDFPESSALGIRALSPVPRLAEAWFGEFVACLRAARGVRHWPVCRLGDGEMLFAVGPQPPDLRRPPAERAGRAIGRWACGRWPGRGAPGLNAGDPGRYSSGRYTAEECAAARPGWSAALRQIAADGVVAAHLCWQPGVLFAEHSFPALDRYLRAAGIGLDATNYVPFYFVYAALLGPAGAAIVRGARVLVVAGMPPAARAAAAARLRALGARTVAWVHLTPDRALFDRVVPAPGHVDLVLLGAGVGKPLVLAQLRGVAAPCIDAGFVLSVWADPDAAAARPFCRPSAPPAAGA